MKKSKSTFKLNKQKVASLEVKTIKGGAGNSGFTPVCGTTEGTWCYICPDNGGGDKILR